MKNELDFYLQRSGLAHAEQTIPDSLDPDTLHHAFDRLRLVHGQLKKTYDRHSHVADVGLGLFHYLVPPLSNDGFCTQHTSQRDTFSLTSVFGERTVEHARSLATLRDMLLWVLSHLECDWVGIYGRFGKEKDSRLVKLVYFGGDSRAEFFLTEEWEKRSLNSKVGRTGRAFIVDDIEKRPAGVPYYECDTSTRSEVCLPILHPDSDKPVGIIDAEANDPSHFAPERVAWITALGILCTPMLTSLQQ